MEEKRRTSQSGKINEQTIFYAVPSPGVILYQYDQNSKTYVTIGSIGAAILNERNTDKFVLFFYKSKERPFSTIHLSRNFIFTIQESNDSIFGNYMDGNERYSIRFSSQEVSEAFLVHLNFANFLSGDKNDVYVSDVILGKGDEVHDGDTVGTKWKCFQLHTSVSPYRVSLYSENEKNSLSRYILGAANVLPAWNIGTLGMKSTGSRIVACSTQFAVSNEFTFPTKGFVLFLIKLQRIKRNRKSSTISPLDTTFVVEEMSPIQLVETITQEETRDTTPIHSQVDSLNSPVSPLTSPIESLSPVLGLSSPSFLSNPLVPPETPSFAYLQNLNEFFMKQVEQVIHANEKGLQERNTKLFQETEIMAEELGVLRLSLEVERAKLEKLEKENLKLTLDVQTLNIDAQNSKNQHEQLISKLHQELETKETQIKSMTEPPLIELDIPSLELKAKQLLEKLNLIHDEIFKKKKREAQTNLCVVCIDKEKEFVCIPCGHFVYCKECAQQQYQYCPLCRAQVNMVTKIFI